MEVLGIWMLVALTVLLLLGSPVALAIGATALFFGWFQFGLDIFKLLPLRIWGLMTNLTLIAVPLFVFMGLVLERSGIADELLDTMSRIFGRLRGGLAISVVLVGALLAASTGIVGGIMVTMGLLALPAMLRHKYPPELASGTICAAGTLGQLIPPSIVLIVLGDVMGVSVADLFAAAFLPGLLLVALYVLYIIVIGVLKPAAAPAASDLGELSMGELLWKILRALVPPGALIAGVLGSIFFGIATPTESAAVGALGALLLCLFYRRFSWKMLKESMLSTMRLTSMVFLVVIGASAFGLVFGLGGREMVKSWLLNIPGDQMGFIIATMILIFLLGIFFEFLEISLIAVPLLVAPAQQLGIDLTWYAVLIAMNLQTAFLSPPVGASLFFLRSVAPPGVTMGHIFKGVIPFMILQLVGVAILIFFPQIALWLPKLR
ncbi:TRAP transporter large permease subunit [Candidatus Acetothermia bacterium]|jgi:tripartite ATP-independent transporter DctM subunit|nr:TRAP transporter large permease subunit [Candidatus Acetothermia bacterium]MCI2436634.1 TRAP transporter large permease subunit [Candidatus Acetothermia bacterium]